jgi:hypothetical protein
VGLAGVAKQNGMANGTSTMAGWMPVFIARNGMALVRTGRCVALKKKEKRGRGSVGSGDDGASKWKNLFTVARCSLQELINSVSWRGRELLLHGHASGFVSLVARRAGFPADLQPSCRARVISESLLADYKNKILLRSLSTLPAIVPNPRRNSLRDKMASMEKENCKKRDDTHSGRTQKPSSRTKHHCWLITKKQRGCVMVSPIHFQYKTYLFCLGVHCVHEAHAPSTYQHRHHLQLQGLQKQPRRRLLEGSNTVVPSSPDPTSRT